MPSSPAPQQSPGTSPSSAKRKWGLEDDGSDISHPRTRASSTSDFNNNTKAQVRAQHDHKCWHCGASPADVCHVIGSKDNTFQEAVADGLIDFLERSSLQNAVALCRTCHTNFDHLYKPTFFFLPTNLKYFLTYEQQDQKRRRRLGRRTGTIPARMCPTAQTYQDHQVKNGIQGAESGGLYTRIVIHDFLPQYPGRASFRPGLSEYGGTKPWTGSPMATLQRAMLMLRKLNLSVIPREIRDALRELQDAYSEELDLEMENSSDVSTESDVEDAEGVLHELLGRNEAPGRTEDNEGREIESGDGVRGLKDGMRNKLSTGGAAGDSHEYPPKEVGMVQRGGIQVERNHSRTDGSRFWKWGPDATSNDAATFFRRVS